MGAHKAPFSFYVQETFRNFTVMETIILKVKWPAKVWKFIKSKFWEMYREEYLAHHRFFNFFNLYVTREEFVPNYKAEFGNIVHRCIATGKIVKSELIPI